MTKEIIYHPGKNDVLSGRGKFAMSWPGNLFYRELIELHRENYLKANDNSKKQQIAVNIFSEIHCRSPSGRFLMLGENRWVEIDDQIALRKTKQALREGEKSFNTKISKKQVSKSKFECNKVIHKENIKNKKYSRILITIDENEGTLRHPKHEECKDIYENNFPMPNWLTLLDENCYWFSLDKKVDLSKFDPREVFANEV